MPAVIIPPRGINKKLKFSRLDHIFFLELVIEADRSGTPAGFSPVLFFSVNCFSEHPENAEVRKQSGSKTIHCSYGLPFHFRRLFYLFMNLMIGAEKRELHCSPQKSRSI